MGYDRPGDSRTEPLPSFERQVSVAGALIVGLVLAGSLSALAASAVFLLSHSRQPVAADRPVASEESPRRAVLPVAVPAVKHDATVERAREGEPPAAAPERRKVPEKDLNLPFKECKAAIDWLNSNENDPRSVEVIRWEPPAKHTPFPGYPGDVRIVVKYRAKNVSGALQVRERCFVLFNDGRISYTYSLDGNDR